MSDLGEIEDLEEGQVAALAGLGLRTTDDLLAAGAAPAGRRRLARELGVDEAHVLRWVNHADLHRVPGIGEQYADLLEEAGVDTVPELAQRNAANLVARLAAVNGERSLVARLPTEAVVAGWIEGAKALPRVIVYRDAPGGAVETALGTAGPAVPAEPAAALLAEAPAVEPVPAVEAAAGELTVSVPAQLEREAAEAMPARAAFDGGIALPAEERPPRVGLTLDTSAALAQSRAHEERAARSLWQRVIDRLTGV